MLRVAVETQFSQGASTGIGVYASRLVEALRKRGDVTVVDLVDPDFDLWRFDRRVYWDQLRSRRLARAAQVDVVHFTGGTLPLVAPHPCVLTVHDLAWLRAANPGRPYVRWYFGRFQPWLARRADALVVDSDAARMDVADGLDVDPARIAVGGAGVDERFFALERTPVSPPLVLAVGTVEARKNLATAVRALNRLPNTRLISVGVPTPYERIVRAEIARLELRDRVELLGYVSDAELLRLYSAASALIFPSRYEGFGLPPLQALAAGVPVVASDIPVLREVLGNAAAYAPPDDDLAFSNALRKALAGGPAIKAQIARGRARARTFTWSLVADRMMVVYRSLRHKASD
jgi:glycosyltransferase involved in cell wall biosynthesis